MKQILVRAGIPLAALAGLALVGCSGTEENKVVELRRSEKALVEEKVRAQEDLGVARSVNAEMQATLDEVQRDLEELRVKELKAIQTSVTIAQEGKASRTTRERLKAEIEDIRKAVRANLEKLAALQRANRASDERVTTLERLVLQLHRQFEEKEEAILALEERTKVLSESTGGLREALREKEQAVQQMKAVLAEREAQLATAYVLIARLDILKKADFVEKRGSFLGLGGNWRRTGQFAENLFKQIDTRQVRTFDVAAPPGKVLILSDHPKDSYVLAAVSPSECVLTVRDAERFWRMSRELIVMLPD